MILVYLLILDGTFSEDIITTGMSLRELDSCKSIYFLSFLALNKRWYKQFYVTVTIKILVSKFFCYIVHFLLQQRRFWLWHQGFLYLCNCINHIWSRLYAILRIATNPQFYNFGENKTFVVWKNRSRTTI